MKRILLIIITLITVFGCNKDKKFSNRIDGESWKASKIQISDNEITDLPTLTFDECKIYKENCTGIWILNGVESNFAWQFRDKGTLFEISNQSIVTQSQESAIIQCMNLSGVYNVDEQTKEILIISSESTIGYTNSKVIIELEKQ